MKNKVFIIIAFLLLTIIVGCLKNEFVDIGPVLIDKDLVIPENLEPEKDWKHIPAQQDK